jgi:hypothetical protein
MTALSSNGRRVVPGAGVTRAASLMNLPGATPSAPGLFPRAHRHLGPGPDTGALAPSGGQSAAFAHAVFSTGAARHRRPTSGELT